ncbi:GNAT family N-acetyltransferase, partial [candidate division GN15 bacterium]|nr:GNAT family N-acetyltransferase [candidate division GN15 bacterium]
MDIRPLTPDSYDAVIELWIRAGLGHRPKGRDTRERMTAEMTDPHCRYIGAFDSERLIGVVIANFTYRRAWIERLAVDPDYRGQRLAGQLIAEAERFLNEKGALVISA